jgi:hypothetical protein
VKGLKPTLVTAIAIGLLAGSTVGVTAQDEEPDPAGAVAFKGQWGCDEQISPLARFDHGDVASLANSVALPVLKMSDPRLDGVTTWSAIRSIWSPDPESPFEVEGVPFNGKIVSNVTTVRIATGEGAWQGGFIDAGNFGKQGLRGPLVLIGEGDYEGSTVFMDPQASPIKKSECGGWNVRGFIVEGGLPAAPAAAEAVPAAQ